VQKKPAKPSTGPDYVSPALWHLCESIDDISPDPSNARKHPQRNIDALKASLRKYKMQRPIVVGTDHIIRDGSGTWQAARELGWSHIAVVVSDLPLPELAGYAIAVNRIPELAEWDFEALKPQLDSIDETFKSLLDVNSPLFQKLLGNVPTIGSQAPGTDVNNPYVEWNGMPEFQHDEQRSFKKLIVHFRSADDIAAFAKLVGQAVTADTRFIWYPPVEIESYSDKRYA
jgi:hypothetical protein